MKRALIIIGLVLYGFNLDSQIKLLNGTEVNPLIKITLEKECRPYIEKDIKANIEENLVISELFYNYKKVLKGYHSLRYEIVPYCFLSHQDSILEADKIIQNIYVDTTILPREIIFYKGRKPVLEFYFFSHQYKSSLITSYHGTVGSILGVPKFKWQRRLRNLDFKGYFPELLSRPFVVKKGKIFLFSKRYGGKLFRGEKSIYNSDKEHSINQLKTLPYGMELL